MVGRAKLIGQVEVGHIVVVPAVLKRNRLDRVNVPDVDVVDDGIRFRRGEHVVEGSDCTAEGVAVLAGLCTLVDVASVGEDLQRVFQVVGVEVPGEEDAVDTGVGLQRVGKGNEGCGLVNTRSVRGTLTIIHVRVHTRSGALRLEVVDDREEAAVGVADQLEGLGERLASIAEGSGAGQDARGTDQFDGSWLVDEGRADDVFIGG